MDQSRQSIIQRSWLTTFGLGGEGPAHDRSVATPLASQPRNYGRSIGTVKYVRPLSIMRIAAANASASTNELKSAISRFSPAPKPLTVT
jgi:hypothetical protein